MMLAVSKMERFHPLLRALVCTGMSRHTEMILAGALVLSIAIFVLIAKYRWHLL